METTTKPAHIGRKIGRIRELRGIKQEYLATELGVSQQTISRMEASESVDADLLDKVAGILGVSVEAIKSFSEEAVINFFNTFNDASVNNGMGNYNTFNFNPIDKLIEVFEENKTLYERLLKSEQEKVELLKGKA
jgi:transcriptional regulator with XRE-family HTH domain